MKRSIFAFKSGDRGGASVAVGPDGKVSAANGQCFKRGSVTKKRSFDYTQLYAACRVREIGRLADSVLRQLYCWLFFGFECQGDYGSFLGVPYCRIDVAPGIVIFGHDYDERSRAGDLSCCLLHLEARSI